MDYKLKNFDNFINSYQILSLDIPHFEKSGVFFILENEKERNEVLKSILFFNNIFFNQKFNINYKIDVKFLLDVIDKKPFLCLLTLDELFKKIPSKKEFIKNVLILKKDEKIKITEIVSKLLTIGYKYDHNINIDNSSFKNYGDILEIRKIDKLYKIELLGNRIEKVFLINPDNKKKIEEIEKLEIFPTDEVLSFEETFINDYINNNSYFIYHENIESEINSIFTLDNYNKIVFSKIFSKKYSINTVENYKGNFKKIQN